MAVELFIQHNSTIQFPVVEEGARLTLERKGTPGKLEFTVVKGPGLNFAEGDPVKLTVNGTAMFYGFVFNSVGTPATRTAVVGTLAISGKPFMAMMEPPQAPWQTV